MNYLYSGFWMEVMMLAPVSRPASLADLAYSQLRDGVLSGRLLRDGQRISVVTLAAQLEMSRTPVRSAVERLVAEGLVDLQPAGVALVRHHHGELLQILQVRAVLEGLSARLATSRLDADSLAELDKVHARFQQAIDAEDIQAARQIDIEFHQLIMAASDNPFLVEDLTRVQARVIVGTYSIAWTPAHHHAIDEHASILTALHAGDAELAQTRAIAHMEHLMHRIQAVSGHNGS